jgi:urea transporter/murein DD-endopeptidase MepM/ murein hydrolase activator NlpD
MTSQFLRASLMTYGTLAFSTHPVPAILVLLASFFHPMVGLMGVIGNLVSNLVARWMGANRQAWNAGIFGISGLLVGLALGMFAVPTARMWAFLIVGAAISAIISVLMGALLAKSNVPILSMPFMLVIWAVLLTVGVARGDVSYFPSIGILRIFDHWLFDHLPLAFFQFVKMFGNILFQENLISGVLVLVAIGLYSRISLLYGFWGGVLGLATHMFLNGSMDGFHGLNFLLTALAFGGFFVVANFDSWILASLAIITVGIVDLATTKVLAALATVDTPQLPSLVFAFNVVTLTFLYPLKKIATPSAGRRLIPVPLEVIRSPEANLRWMKRWMGRRYTQKTILTFPFMGTWSVMQGNDGEWTHKGTGRHAWDFVIRDPDGKQAREFGLKVTDYYAFGLPVLAPAPGVVLAVENTVEDNPPREATTERNWGNYVIIDHGLGEYSELSHFKKSSIIVVPGQRVDRGQLLGCCGNSGRSPVPHIHFQLQSMPQLGSPTLPAKFAEGVLDGHIHLNIVPKDNDSLAPVEIDSEATWTLLGKESEQWIFQCKMGLYNCKETLTFSTDAYGYPAISSKQQFLWYIIDKPNFVEIIPDFKTFPSLLSPSGWIRIVGESLVLPKKLNHGLTWNGGGVVDSVESLWIVESQGREIAIDTQIGIIKQVKIIDKPEFSFVLTSTSRLLV